MRRFRRTVDSLDFLCDPVNTPFWKYNSALKQKFDSLKSELALEIDKFPKIEGQQGNHLSNSSNQLLQTAQNIAKEMNDDFITLEHLLLGIIQNVSPISQLLKDKGVTFDNTKKLVTEVRNGERVTSENAEGTYNSLNKYAKNLTDLAKEGKLDPVIGRDEEIRRVLQILSRRTKNNPILIGEPGVGKTAIAEGLAHRIISGDVPENLLNKQIFFFFFCAFVASAKYNGEFEERFKAVV